MLPQEFSSYTSQLFGAERWERFLASMSEVPPVSIRLNPFKRHHGDSLSTLLAESTAVPWCRDAFWLAQRPRFTSDPLFHAGVYYVQEAGSMFLDTVLRKYVKAPVCMLDLCAAPGGKSTLSRAVLPEGSLLFSNEPDRHRANILLENIIKQGHGDVVVTSNYAAGFSREKISFDVILVDAPCSGEGMFRKDHAAIEEWSMRNVVKCSELQKSILRDIWPSLSPGGLLIYSTCTFNVMENEENVRMMCEEFDAEVLPVELSPEWNICGSLLPGFSLPVYRFIPGITRSEGLFMAVIRKPGEGAGCERDKAKVLSRLRKGVNVIYDGVPRGEQKGKDVIPSHAEAMSSSAIGCYPHVEVSLSEALHYLHRETLTLPSDAPRGYVVVTYLGHPLGFVKNLGNRANNLYPKEWAIRSLITP